MRMLAKLGLTLALIVGLVVPVAAQNAAYPRQDDAAQVRGTAVRQKDLVNLLKALRNSVFDNPVLAAGTTAATVKTTAAVQYRINGAVYNKAATDDFCSLAPHAANVIGLTTGAYFRFEIDAAGNCGVLMGPLGAVASGTVNGRIVMPPRSANKATLGVLLVAGVAFTPGTTATTASANKVFTNGDPDLIDLLEP